MLPPETSRDGLDSSRSSSSDREKVDAHLLAEFEPKTPQGQYRSRQQQCQCILYAVIAVQFAALFIAVGFIWNGTDPTLAIWCMSCFTQRSLYYDANKASKPPQRIPSATTD